MKKFSFNIVTSALLLLFVIAVGYHVVSTTNQAMPSVVIDTEFVGEYSINGSDWNLITEDTKWSSFDGDLILRGKIKEQYPLYLTFYLNHIGVSISVNGEQVFYSGRWENEVPEMMCGSYFSGWLDDTLEAEDELELRLHNPHKYGNPDAYNEFLDSLHYGGDEALKNHYEPLTRPYRIIGIFLLVSSIILLGMALGYRIQKLPSASLLWSMGLTSLFMGGYFYMDTIDVSLHSNLIVFNTFLRQCCILFAALEFVNGIKKTLTGREEKIAFLLVTLLKVADGVLLFLALMDLVSLYDTGLYWAIAQGVTVLAMFVLCVLEYRKGEKNQRAFLLSYMVLLMVLCFELINGRVGVLPGGILIKAVFLLFYLFHLIRAVKLVTVNHQTAIKAKELEEELKNSRVALAMSQIKPHFIYNALGAIRSLCVEDSQVAIETIDHFSGYLRGSLETMDKEKCISFQKEMEFVENYLYLEQRRFEHKIKVKKEIKEEDFLLPPMSVQPLVENAVRHGIRKKKNGGTIVIKSFAMEEEYLVTVEDDGVGFDVSVPEKDGKVHVGLENVEKRLNLMCQGTMEVESNPGQGTKVILHIPKRHESSREK